ncbi:MAG: DNA polymerase IV [bacterium]
MTTRKIIHVDMDAFYASVEQRDNPDHQGKPVIVGGDPEGRGVVAACSYEARKYGIHSAMPASRAYRLCPHAVFIRPRFRVYESVSREVHEIFHEYTDLVEPLSLDEAYLDVTENKKNIPSATEAAKQIKDKIKQKTGLTASAGVSFNKFLAKVASAWQKPDGLTVITPEKAPEFIDRLPVGKFHGVGKVTEQKMKEIGIKTGADLKRLSREELTGLFGKAGEYYHAIAHGEDDRQVNPSRDRKSVGKEKTFERDISDREEALRMLEELAGKVYDRLEQKGLKGRTVTLKVRYADFTLITRSLTLEDPPATAVEIMKNVKKLLDKTKVGEKPVRLLGVSISGLAPWEDYPRRWRQMLLPFPDPPSEREDN